MARGAATDPTPATAPADAATITPPAAPAPIAPARPADPDDLYVSCVPENGPCARFAATGRPGPAPIIGAERDPTVEGNLRYFPERIDLVPGAEYRQYVKEYRRALADRTLRMRTRDEWEAQNAPTATTPAGG